MRFTILFAVFLSLAAIAQADDSLAVTLPTGKVVHFQTAEQKAKFLAAQERAKQAPQTQIAVAGGKSAEQVKAEWDRAQAAKKAQEDLDAKSTTRYFLIWFIQPDGVIAHWSTADRQWSDESLFITCKPDPGWADHTVFKAAVYPDGTKEAGGRHLNNFRINGAYAH